MTTDELKDRLESKYGSLDDDRGCYVNGKWLSVRAVAKLIDLCEDEYDLADQLESKYGSLDDERGCYIGSEWLSVKDLVDMYADASDY